MSYHSVEEFAKMRSSLAQLLVSTAARFADDHGLAKFNEPALRQLSTPVHDVALELLLFGADAWPEYVLLDHGSDFAKRLKGENDN